MNLNKYPSSALSLCERETFQLHNPITAEEQLQLRFPSPLVGKGAPKGWVRGRIIYKFQKLRTLNSLEDGVVPDDCVVPSRGMHVRRTIKIKKGMT